MLGKVKFGDVGQGRYNNFDFLRFFFATSVIFSHSFAFLYNHTMAAYDPLLKLTNQTAFGGGAVDSFFLISGFLVAQSWSYSPHLGDFARKRALRILPGLIVVLAFCVFVVGPLAVHNRGAYFHNPASYRYLGLMFTKDLETSDRLPGVFVHNPEENRVDGSLWTIRYEMLCYVMVALIGLAALKTRAWLTTAVFATTMGGLMLPWVNLAFGGKVHNLLHLVAYFTVGMLFFELRKRIPYSGVLFALSIALLVVACHFGVLAIVMPVLWGYALFYMAFSKALPLQRWGRFGDFSYGLYLYACPIGQLLVTYYRSSFNAYSLFAATFGITLALAIMSWHLVEHPFLKLKRKTATDNPRKEELADAPTPRLDIGPKDGSPGPEMAVIP
ncbi:MAG: acyltransferase family protein [Capsulimonadaceae bacterium]